MKSDLFIRADGSTQTGLGHLVRCISLGNILDDQFNISFVCREIPLQMEDELVQQGISLIKIDREEMFLNRIHPKCTVVLDGYSFDSAYQQKVKNLGCTLAFVDDLHDREFFADLILNHAPGIKKSDYKAQTYTKFGLGPEFALLRPPFLEAARSVDERARNNIEHILICFGGSDSENLTIRALNVVLNFNQFKKITIITGSAYNYADELLRTIKNQKKVVHHHALSGEKMAAAFLESDVAIVPSSGILFEALATGNISISGTYTDNQKEVYAGFKELNAVIDAGEFSEDQMSRAIQEVGKKKLTKGIIDGNSPHRIRTLFKTIQRD